MPGAAVPEDEVVGELAAGNLEVAAQVDATLAVDGDGVDPHAAEVHVGPRCAVGRIPGASVGHCRRLKARAALVVDHQPPAGGVDGADVAAAQVERAVGLAQMGQREGGGGDRRRAGGGEHAADHRQEQGQGRQGQQHALQEAGPIHWPPPG